eukprot:7386918-Prymnesium_polylepis.2
MFRHALRVTSSCASRHRVRVSRTAAPRTVLDRQFRAITNQLLVSAINAGPPARCRQSASRAI